MELFKKPNSKFYWYDFTLRGRHYRGSTQETKADRATKIAGLKLAQAVEGADPLPKKRCTLAEFSERFLTWLTEARLESQTKRYCRNGWRMLKTTAVVGMRLDEITDDHVPRLTCQHQLRVTKHDYGTRILMRPGNLSAVMKTMGHRDVKTAIHYQHPEPEIVRLLSITLRSVKKPK